MTLDLYIARRFLGSFLRVFGIFLGVLLLIDLIEQIRRFSDIGIGLSQALLLALLNVPQNLYRILPLLMILSAITLFLGLARSSELVVVRASGRAGLRFLLAPVATALGIGLLAVAVFNPLVAATSKEYERRSSALTGGAGGSVLSLSAEGLWLRQGDATGQTVIHAGQMSPEGTELSGVTFHLFSPEGSVTGRIEAGRARLQAGEWALEGAKVWTFDADNPETSASLATAPLRLPTDLTPAQLIEGLGEQGAVAFWDLPAQAQSLERAGFSARGFRLEHQMELALPLLLAAMVLVAAGFTMRHARFGKTGQMVLYALMAGFFIFFLRNFAQVLGENGQIPVLVAAWTPPVAAALLSLSLLLHLEDG
ncbi:LPS export ABC transporter permease LptG [Tabrizicola oligotrophica]|uniref:LPS export ABC transporter permease LptG n=1 Tax=Tabrizicola oligotrophica TaxID=2710650 RepID=A0A6M0QNY5_9RHOB|nr:LPS export ABC transporter permease LptG [Tabrizicola oligotrophica]NEY89180.1 LPS export ABC transporter permease LptG [Tabrizicola oligotrophica]